MQLANSSDGAKRFAPIKRRATTAVRSQGSTIRAAPAVGVGNGVMRLSRHAKDRQSCVDTASRGAAATPMLLDTTLGINCRHENRARHPTDEFCQDLGA
jgi:hypothetical protein